MMESTEEKIKISVNLAAKKSEFQASQVDLVIK